MRALLALAALALGSFRVSAQVPPAAPTPSPASPSKTEVKQDSSTALGTVQPVSAHLDLNWNADDGVLALEGDLDPASAPSFRARVDEILDGGVTALTVDLSGVEFIDSSGLRELMRADQRLSGEGESLVIRNPSSGVATLFELTGLDRRLKISQG